MQQQHNAYPVNGTEVIQAFRGSVNCNKLILDPRERPDLLLFYDISKESNVKLNVNVKKNTYLFMLPFHSIVLHPCVMKRRSCHLDSCR